jgi:hypothetical protein
MNKYDFKVEQPTLLAASFSVQTSADDEPIICNFDENGKCSLTVPSDMDVRLLSAVQDICEAQFAPSVMTSIRANRFFDEAIAEAKNVPSPDDTSSNTKDEIFHEIVKRIITDVDTSDYYQFKDFLTDQQLTFESLGNALLRLSAYIELKKEKEV